MKPPTLSYTKKKLTHVRFKMETISARYLESLSSNEDHASLPYITTTKKKSIKFAHWQLSDPNRGWNDWIRKPGYWWNLKKHSWLSIAMKKTNAPSYREHIFCHCLRVVRPTLTPWRWSHPSMKLRLSLMVQSYNPMRAPINGLKKEKNLSSRKQRWNYYNEWAKRLSWTRSAHSRDLGKRWAHCRSLSGSYPSPSL